MTSCIIVHNYFFIRKLNYSFQRLIVITGNDIGTTRRVKMGVHVRKMRSSATYSWTDLCFSTRNVQYFIYSTLSE